jgi:hypothetical protein
VSVLPYPPCLGFFDRRIVPDDGGVVPVNVAAHAGHGRVNVINGRENVM